MKTEIEWWHQYSFLQIHLPCDQTDEIRKSWNFRVMWRPTKKVNSALVRGKIYWGSWIKLIAQCSDLILPEVTFSLNEQNTVRYINIKLVIIQTQRSYVCMMEFFFENNQLLKFGYYFCKKRHNRCTYIHISNKKLTNF